MRANRTLPNCKAIIKGALGVIVRALLGAAVGASGAGLFGVLYSILDGLSHGDASRFTLTKLGFFAICGAGAGALAGAFAPMIDPEGVANLTSGSPKITRKRRVVFQSPRAFGNLLLARQWFLKNSSSESDTI